VSSTASEETPIPNCSAAVLRQALIEEKDREDELRRVVRALARRERAGRGGVGERGDEKHRHDRQECAAGHAGTSTTWIRARRD